MNLLRLICLATLLLLLGACSNGGGNGNGDSGGNGQGEQTIAACTWGGFDWNGCNWQ